jgi:hypothetical protein
MNRRNFFGLMVGGVAASTAVRTWPFRVFSFPTEIKYLAFPGSFTRMDPADMAGFGVYDESGGLSTNVAYVSARELEQIRLTVPIIKSSQHWVRWPSNKKGDL